MADGASADGNGDALQADTGEVYTDPVYVYALVRQVPSLVLPEMGIDSQRPVELLSTGAVAAVFSTVRHELFNEAAIEAGLRNRAWLEAHVLVHQQVIDALVGSGATVIPMRFCTSIVTAAPCWRSWRATLRHSSPNWSGLMGGKSGV
ncbi:MAG: GvpL/GvpF family gas vesicle protein [Anaerolineales bacterium]|nr:GvpL/GvpF family gas vesicle protein [Anaerolineales bacterium]